MKISLNYSWDLTANLCPQIVLTRVNRNLGYPSRVCPGSRATTGCGCNRGPGRSSGTGNTGGLRRTRILSIPSVPGSAELKGPRKLLRIRPEISNFDPDSGLKLGIRHSTHKPAQNDSERFWADFGVFRRRSETFKL